MAAVAWWRSIDDPSTTWLACGAVAAGLLVTAGLAIGSMRMDSATDDEPAHIVAGYLKVKLGHFDFFSEQPPLIDSLSSLPLAFRDVPLPAGWDAADANPWRVGQGFLFRSGGDADSMIFLARLPNVAMLLLLTLLVYAWALELTGSRVAAMASSTLAAFCPNLIAHGRLATVDMGAAFFCTLSAFTFLRFLRSPTVPRAGAAGACLGLAILTKVSALILLPWAALSTIAFVLVERERRALFFLLAARLAIVAGAALIVFEAVYLVEMRRASPLAPFLEYSKSVNAVFRWIAQPYDKPQYLLGSFSYGGWRTYYLIAMLLKTPLTTSALIAVAFFGPFVPYARRVFTRSDVPAPWPLDVWAILLFVVLFLAVACASTLNIGLRYVLPVYPFLYVLVAPVAVRAVAAAGQRQAVVVGAIALLVCGSVAAGIAAYPGYIGYFNALVRSKDADRYLIDSNLDWGQDLKRLKRWIDENRIPSIGVRYFGGGSVRYTLGPMATNLASCAPTGAGYYAISRHIYRLGNFYAGDATRDCEHNFRDARLVTTVGDSILVFQVPPN